MGSRGLPVREDGISNMHVHIAGYSSAKCLLSQPREFVYHLQILLCFREGTRDTRSGTQDSWVCNLGSVHYLKSLPGWHYLVTWRGWFQRLCWLRHLLTRDYRTQQRSGGVAIIVFSQLTHSISVESR